MLLSRSISMQVSGIGVICLFLALIFWRNGDEKAAQELAGLRIQLAVAEGTARVLERANVKQTELLQEKFHKNVLSGAASGGVGRSPFKMYTRRETHIMRARATSCVHARRYVPCMVCVRACACETSITVTIPTWRCIWPLNQCVLAPVVAR